MARPIAHFAFHGAISPLAVAQYEVKQQDRGECQLSATTSACLEYQYAACAPHNLRLGEVCWFNNYPHSLPSCGSVSISDCFRTPECQLSQVLWFQLFNIESMLLNQEHELLRAALDPTWHPPDHSYHKPNQPIHAPMRPADKLLAKLFLRCGVNERYPLETVVTEVRAPYRNLRQAGQRYSSRLPSQKYWFQTTDMSCFVALVDRIRSLFSASGEHKFMHIYARQVILNEPVAQPQEKCCRRWS